MKDKIDTYVKAGTAMYDTAIKWREGFIRFESKDKSFILNEHWFYFHDDKTDTHLFLGSTSGDFSISESEAR